jgi:hypothetical protein
MFDSRGNKVAKTNGADDKIQFDYQPATGLFAAAALPKVGTEAEGPGFLSLATTATVVLCRSWRREW